jgi:hypothetical protein
MRVQSDSELLSQYPMADGNWLKMYSTPSRFGIFQSNASPAFYKFGVAVRFEGLAGLITL